MNEWTIAIDGWGALLMLASTHLFAWCIGFLLGSIRIRRGP
jgi:hypothetical protein